MTFQTINPINNKFVKAFDQSTDIAVEKAISQAAIVFDEWKHTDYQTRKTKR